MRQGPNEEYTDWVKRVRMHEFGRALQALAKGEDPKLVATVMSVRITDKMLYPLMKKLNNDQNIT
jgi:glutamyl-tRNA reductase